jgi:hypothetical protein
LAPVWSPSIPIIGMTSFSTRWITPGRSWR